MKDYEFKTTFWNDFSVADKFGTDAVNETFKRAFNTWKDNYIYLTELVLVLNWKSHQHKQENNRLCNLYNKLYEKANDYAIQTLKFEKLDYYFDNVD